jgi:hypothetical protein
MTFFSLDPLFDITIYAFQVCSLVLSLPMNSTKALGRKCNNKTRLREDPQIPHIKESLESEDRKIPHIEGSESVI